MVFVDSTIDSFRMLSIISTTKLLKKIIVRILSDFAMKRLQKMGYLLLTSTSSLITSTYSFSKGKAQRGKSSHYFHFITTKFKIYTFMSIRVSIVLQI